MKLIFMLKKGNWTCTLISYFVANFVKTDFNKTDNIVSECVLVLSLWIFGWRC